VRVVITPRDGAPREDASAGADPVRAECAHFAAVVAGEADPALLDASEAVEDLRVLDGLRRSLSTGAWADLPAAPRAPG
jgi:predicted dehydrogenase